MSYWDLSQDERDELTDSEMIEHEDDEFDDDMCQEIEEDV